MNWNVVVFFKEIESTCHEAWWSKQRTSSWRSESGSIMSLREIHYRSVQRDTSQLKVERLMNIRKVSSSYQRSRHWERIWHRSAMWNAVVVSSLLTVLDVWTRPRWLVESLLVTTRKGDKAPTWSLSLQFRRNPACTWILPEREMSRIECGHPGISCSRGVKEFPAVWTHSRSSRLHVRMSKNLSYRLKVNEFTDLDNQWWDRVRVPVQRAISPTMCGVTWSTWELMSTASTATPGPNYDS